MLYEEFMFCGTLCSILVCVGVIVASCYRGITVFRKVKDQAFKSVFFTVIQACCCGVGSTLVDNYQWVANGFQQPITTAPRATEMKDMEHQAPPSYEHSALANQADMANAVTTYHSQTGAHTAQPSLMQAGLGVAAHSARPFYQMLSANRQSRY